jgi:hypothetical protein
MICDFVYLKEKKKLWKRMQLLRKKKIILLKTWYISLIVIIRKSQVQAMKHDTDTVTRHGYSDTDNVKNIGYQHCYIYGKIWILSIDLLLKKLKLKSLILHWWRCFNTCLTFLDMSEI